MNVLKGAEILDPKQQALRSKQRERQQRGTDFQDEVRRSWKNVPHTWQLTIKDGGGGSRPADKLVLCEEVNLLIELKRTEGDAFKLGFLRPNQVHGLVDFDNVIPKNYGLVGVSFHNEKKGVDECYFFRLVHALNYMHKKDRVNITREELKEGAIPRIEAPRITAALPTYDLKGVSECYKYL